MTDRQAPHCKLCPILQERVFELETELRRFKRLNRERQRRYAAKKKTK